MKNILRILIAAACCLFASCEAYLMQQPTDKPTTAADIFFRKDGAEQFLYNVYSFIPKFWVLSAESGASDQRDMGNPYGACSDELDVMWYHHGTMTINNGSWNPNSAPYSRWRFLYQGIREANYFMENIHFCSELTHDPDQTQYTKRIAEARFLRAYFYFHMMRMYGPVVLMGDEVVDIDAELHKGRNTWEECVEYVSNEFLEASRDLPLVWDNTNWGRATQGAALAFRSQLLLHAASELFNTDNSMYSGWKSIETGEELMPVAYDEQKWRDAAEAAKEVIDLNYYKLSVVTNTTGDIDPYKSMEGIFFSNKDNGPLQTELIFGRQGVDKAFIQRLMPACFNSGWGGYNPTQKQVDAFAMKSGRYPITGYGDVLPGRDDGTVPIIDASSSYAETGVRNNYEHPWDKQTINTFMMYVDREPRFYFNIMWDNMKIPYDVLPTGLRNEQPTFTIDFGFEGNSQTGNNYSVTGYSVRKLFSRENNPQSGNNGIFFFPVWPIIRLGEIYLNYVEALIEYDHMNSDVLYYWNLIRARAGVPPIEEVYPDVVGNKEKLRHYLRRERQVELCFENVRYFDIRRWVIAEKTQSGPVYGMDITKEDLPIGTSDFWKRTANVNGVRVFTKKDYFYPIQQRELNRNKRIEQAWGW